MQREMREYLDKDKEFYDRARISEARGDSRRKSLKGVRDLRDTQVKSVLADYFEASGLYKQSGNCRCAMGVAKRGIGFGGEEGMSHTQEYFELQNMLAILTKDQGNGLVNKTAGAIAVISLVASIFFLSFDITGNVVGSQINSGWIGMVLFFLGLIFGISSLRKK